MNSPASIRPSTVLLVAGGFALFSALAAPVAADSVAGDVQGSEDGGVQRVLVLPPPPSLTGTLGAYGPYIVGGLVAVLLALAAATWAQRRRKTALEQLNVTLDQRVAEQTSLLIVKNRRLSEEVARRQKSEAMLVEANRVLEKAASTDPLTGLSNRRAAREALRAEAGRVDRGNASGVVLLADIDDFKNINDRYGHDGGDSVLETVADTLRANLRVQDVIARWGGEEFLVLLPVTNLAGGMAAAEKLRAAVEASGCDHDGIAIAVTMTFGVALLHAGASVDACIRQADEALYAGKDAGKNRVVCLDPAIGPGAGAAADAAARPT